LGYIPDISDKGQHPHADYKDLRFIAVETEDNCISRVIVFRMEKSNEKTAEEEKTRR
jgi:hypothetical protein